MRIAFERCGPSRSDSWRVLAGLCLFLMTLAVGSCDLRRASGFAPTTIGVILPFTSNIQGSGADKVRHALERVLGDVKNIRLVFEDDQGDPTRTAEIVRRLDEEENVQLIVGGMTSPCALSGAERAESLQIPFITPIATHTDVTLGREWVFRVCFTDAQQGRQMARHAWMNLGCRTVAVMRDVTNDYSIGLADAFAETFLELGGRIVAERSFRRGHDDEGDLVDWLDENPCDALYLPLYRIDVIDIISKGARVLKERELILLGGDGWHSNELREFLRRAPNIPDRIYISTHFAADRNSDAVREFVAFYHERERDQPTSADALGYDTGQLLRRVLYPNVRDRQSIHDGLISELSHFEGVTGAVKRDPNTREFQKDIHILTWSGDQWRLAEE